MILPVKILIAYHAIAFNSYYESHNNFIPYQSYTTTYMMQHQDIKVYEMFWNNLIKEGLYKD